MKKTITAVLFSAALLSSGCDVDVNETAPATVPSDSTVSPGGSTSVDIDTDPDSPVENRVENRMERREERRENLRDAIDEVDVNVGDGGVSVDVGNE